MVIVPDHGKAGEGYLSDVLHHLSAIEPKPRVWVIRLPLENENDDIVRFVTETLLARLSAIKNQRSDD